MKRARVFALTLIAMSGGARSLAADPRAQPPRSRPDGHASGAPASSEQPPQSPARESAPAPAGPRREPITPEPASAPASRSYDVAFKAGQVEMTGELETLKLSRDVVVTADRYRLTSEQLEVTRGPRGLEIEGEGRLSFCRCADAPVQIGFQSVTAAPPTDLLVEDPTLRIFGAPVCWLPYLWLRAPTRPGLLPPRVAWRGDDGLLLGAGVYYPLDRKEPERAHVELNAAGYVRGGVEISTKVATPNTTTRARWDYLREHLLAVDAYGAPATRAPAAIAFRIDAVRGERGRRGLLSLEEAARRYDRAELAANHFTLPLVLGFGVRADAARGTPFEEPVTLGPDTFAGVLTELGNVGTAELGVGARTVSTDGQVLTLVRQHAALTLDARPGPFSWSTSLNHWSEVAAAPAETAAATSFGAHSALSLPLRRNYGSVTHWLTPGLQVSGARLGQRDVGYGSSLPDGVVGGAFGALRSTLGDAAQRAGFEFETRAGTLAIEDERARAAAEARALVTSRYVGVSASAGFVGNARDSHVTTSRLRLGRIDGVYVGAYVEGRTEAEPVLLRFVSAEPWKGPHAGYYDRSGWSAGGDAGVPLGRALATSAALDYDVSSEELLAVRGGVAYRHPCGCVAITTWAGHRLGRGGFDAWASVDLMP